MDEIYDRIPVLVSTGRTVDPDLVSAASERIRSNGWVVIRGITDRRHVESVGQAMMDDADRLTEHSRVHRVRAPGHIGQVPPLRPSLVFCDLTCNPTVTAIAHRVFDAGTYLAFYSGHSLMPGAQRQPIHLDLGPLWPSHEIPHPPYILAVNNAVVDIDDANGAMEIWDSSHGDLQPPYQPSTLCLIEEAARGRYPAMRVPMRAGDVLIRDMRLWHRGRENSTAAPRPMMWSLLAAEWYSGGTTARLPQGSREALSTCGVHDRVDWVPDDIDYLLLDL